MTKSDAGKTILITGAAHGLGRALARALAGKGWRLILAARGAAALEEARRELAQKAQVTAIAGEVGDAAYRARLAEAAGQAGGMDALVYFAGRSDPGSELPLLEQPLDALEAALQAEVLAPLGLIQAMRAALKPGARILNVAEVGGGMAGANQAALEQLSGTLAAENPGLRVYWVDAGAKPHDRTEPEAGLLALLEGDYPSGSYLARVVDRPRELRFTLYVDDFAGTVSLYRDGFGLPVVEEWSRLDGSGAVLAVPPATLEIMDRANAASVDRIEAGREMGGAYRLVFQVNDPQAAADRLLAWGVRPVQPPVLTPWGDLNQRVQAADGSQITLYAPPRGKSAAAGGDA